MIKNHVTNSELTKKEIIEKCIQIIKKRRKEVNIFSPKTGDKFVEDIEQLMRELLKSFEGKNEK